MPKQKTERLFITLTGISIIVHQTYLVKLLVLPIKRLQGNISSLPGKDLK